MCRLQTERWTVLSWLCLFAAFPWVAGAQVASQDGEATERPKSLRLAEHQHLPLHTLLPVLETLALRQHSLPNVALAYYQPALLGTAETIEDLRETGLQTASLFVRRGLTASPPGAVAGAPLLVERDDHFELSVLQATPDVAEPLFYSLFMARLHGRYEREPLFAGGVRRRAVGAFGDEAAPEDLAAELIMASSAFASHLLTMANEVERADRRRRARGRSGLCGQLKEGAGLFSLWLQAFEAPSFPVSTFTSDGSERIRDVSKEDRRWVVETLLSDSGWRGRLEDHREICAGSRS